MRTFTLFILVSVIAGCANTEWLDKNSIKRGYKDYDPCIRCGEKWDQIPNQVGEALRRRERGEQW